MTSSVSMDEINKREDIKEQNMNNDDSKSESLKIEDIHKDDTKIKHIEKTDDNLEICEKNLTFKAPALPAPRFLRPVTRSLKLLTHKVDAKTKQIDESNNEQNVLKNNEEEKVLKSNDHEIEKSKDETNAEQCEQEITNKGTKEEHQDKKLEFPYNEPKWAGVSEVPYALTVLKDGLIKNNISMKGKSMLTFGRLDECDVIIEHPSCSRTHALLQYCVEEKDKRKKGLYLYDLGSTHGTYVNKNKVKPKVYNRVRVGYQLKFGGSSRLYIVEGPDEDQEEEVDLDIIRSKRQQKYEEHLKEQKEKRKPTRKMNNLSNEHDDKDEHNKSDDDEGAMWGFGEDAKEEGLDLKELLEKKKNIEIKDPKKSLRGFFEREGLELEYQMLQRGSNNSIIHVAQVRLPIETLTSNEVIAEGTGSNKKEAVQSCATDACRLIQAYDMMQNKSQEDQRLKRQQELEANDFYDSDDDTYLDRTGTIERKRLQRKKWAGKQEKVEVETHETLKISLEKKELELSELEEKMMLSKLGEESEADSLDAYMSSMKHALDKSKKLKIKRNIIELKMEVEKLKKLVEKTKPALPATAVIPTPHLPKTKLTIPGPDSITSSTDPVTSQTPGTTSEEAIIQSIEPGLPVHEKHNEDVDSVGCYKSSAHERKEHIDVEQKQSPQNVKKTSKKRRKRVYGASMKPNQDDDDVGLKLKKSNGTGDTEVTEWMPPANQTGDGRTHLNEKLGY